MDTVKINRAQLLDIVKGNLSQHEKDYQEAIVGYNAELKKVAKENLKIANKTEVGQTPKFKQWPAEVFSYESEYKSAIRKLELSVDENIELDSHDFKTLVEDEWGWKRSFVGTTSMYKGG